MKAILFYFAVLFLYFVKVEGIYLEVNGESVDLFNSSISQFSAISSEEVSLLTPEGTQKSLYWRFRRPTFRFPGNSLEMHCPMDEIKVQASYRKPEDYRMQGLFFDAYVRDHHEGEASTLPCDVYKNPYQPMSFEQIKSYAAVAVDVEHPRVSFGGVFFRLDQELTLRCPTHLMCVIRQLTIAPAHFSYTDQRPDREVGPHDARTFWVKGHVDFANSLFDLTVHNGYISVETCDLLSARGNAPVKPLPTEPPLDLAAEVQDQQSEDTGQ
ncbi:MAG: hypothetical protein C0582_04775 [Alphaproteobacteria bacterium]|nr:MAG: hypothetical protein C0582_04775 [Alphaproteobacteria bacterium]